MFRDIVRCDCRVVVDTGRFAASLSWVTHRLCIYSTSMSWLNKRLPLAVKANAAAPEHHRVSLR